MRSLDAYQLIAELRAYANPSAEVRSNPNPGPNPSPTPTPTPNPNPNPSPNPNPHQVRKVVGGVLALLGRDEEQTVEWDAARQHLKVALFRKEP